MGLLKRFSHWLFVKLYFPEPGIHVMTVVNMKFRSEADRNMANKLFKKYEAIRIAALD
jgi:hypothetical protein